MNLKDFLMPSFYKLNLALMLLVLGGYLVWPLIMAATGVESIPMGFPMATRRVNFVTDSVGDFPPVNFIAVGVDAVFWYLVSSFVALRFKGDQTDS